MTNNIIKLKSGEKLLYKTKTGRYLIYTFENNINLYAKKLASKIIEITCNKCNAIRSVKFYNKLLSRYYLCPKCTKKSSRKRSDEEKLKQSKARQGWYKGEKNPFYGKKHTEENKKKLSDIAKKNKGKKNPFYGKKHTEETKKKIRESLKKYFSSLSLKEKEEYSKKISKSQKKLLNKDPQKYKKDRSKAAYYSTIANNKFKKNKIESIVEKELIKRNITMRHSVILGHLQFDFGNKEKRILLEVQGDYWHGNPNIYGNGENKKSLNSTQKYKIEKDKLKKEFAEKNGFKLYKIWEEDIKNKNFSILDKIERIIKCL